MAFHQSAVALCVMDGWRSIREQFTHIYTSFLLREEKKKHGMGETVPFFFWNLPLRTHYLRLAGEEEGDRLNDDVLPECTSLEQLV